MDGLSFHRSSFGKKSVWIEKKLESVVFQLCRKVTFGSLRTDEVNYKLRNGLKPSKDARMSSNGAFHVAVRQFLIFNGFNTS